jgi:hypothetical protein
MRIFIIAEESSKIRIKTNWINPICVPRDFKQKRSEWKAARIFRKISNSITLSPKWKKGRSRKIGFGSVKLSTRSDQNHFSPAQIPYRKSKVISGAAGSRQTAWNVFVPHTKVDL